MYDSLQKQVLSAAAVYLPNKTARLCLAVSGGVDSVVLAHAVARIAPELSQPLLIVHINHALRGKASDGDERFVASVAKKLNLEFRSFRLAWKKGEKKSQAVYRQKRQELWRELMAEAPSVFALAHHQDDQAETIFLRLLRGTGVRGLQAMKVWDAPLWRPLLGVSRAEILAYAKKYKLKWREDASNASTNYDRNWLRHQILPILEQRRPGVSRRLAALASEVQALVPHLPQNQEAAPQAIETELGLVFRLSELQSASDACVQKVLKLNRTQTKLLRTLLAKEQGKLEVEAKRLWLSRGYLLVYKNEKNLQSSGRVQGGAWVSLLGVWASREWPEAVLLVPASEDTKSKDSLRAARVPAFLRAHVPVLLAKSQCLVPPKLSESYEWPTRGIAFAPSKLAQELWP